MLGSVSTGVVSGYSLTLHLATRGNAVSHEATALRERAAAILVASERSITLFGAKRAVLERIHDVVAEYQAQGWSGEDVAPVSSSAVERAVSFIRALPAGVALPDVGSDPDGSIAFDWIVSRARVFSVSVGAANRLAFAWIDGTDRGHGVARFDGDAVPPRVLAGIREITDGRAAAIRTA